MLKNPQKIARIISTFFVPPSFNLIIFTLFALTLETDFTKKIVTILVSFVFGFALHIFIFVSLRKKGKLIDLDASIKEERTFPFLIAVLIYTLGFIILIYFKVNTVTLIFWFCYISNTLFITFINQYWKISAHTMGAAGPLAVIIYTFPILGIFFFIILILVGWSRINLKCHNLSQVIAGASLGFISTIIQLNVFLNIFHK